MIAGAPACLALEDELAEHWLRRHRHATDQILDVPVEAARVDARNISLINVALDLDCEGLAALRLAARGSGARAAAVVAG